MPDKPAHVEISPRMVDGAVTSDEVLRERYGGYKDLTPAVQQTTEPASKKHDPKPFSASR